MQNTMTMSCEGNHPGSLWAQNIMEQSDMYDDRATPHPLRRITIKRTACTNAHRTDHAHSAYQAQLCGQFPPPRTSTYTLKHQQTGNPTELSCLTPHPAPLLKRRDQGFVPPGRADGAWALTLALRLATVQTCVLAQNGP